MSKLRSQRESLWGSSVQAIGRIAVLPVEKPANNRKGLEDEKTCRHATSCLVHGSLHDLHTSSHVSGRR
jgi:hypothetical protein